MKKLLIISLLSILFLAVSCNVTMDKVDSNLPDEISTVEKKVNSKKPENNDMVNLDRLINSFAIPKHSIENVNFNEGDQVFPIELINKIKMSLVNNNTKTLIDDLTDESLVVEFTDIDSKLSLKDNTDTFEDRLYNLLYSDYPIRYNMQAIFYMIDINNDGKEEILVVEKNLALDDYSSLMLHVLIKENENYIYKASYDLYYNQFCGIFSYEGVYYLIANTDDYETKSTNSVELYILDCNLLNQDTSLSKDVYLLLDKQKNISINKSIDEFNFDVLYENKTLTVADKAISYIDTIFTDLMYAERINNYFYGDEILEEDSLNEYYKDYDNYNKHKPLLSVDVDNDGKKELFIRYNIHEHYIDYPQTTLVWCNIDTLQEYTLDIEFWNNPNYVVTQRWFKEIDKKIISFSLHRKQGEDNYLLDARLHENDETIILADYVIYPINNAYLTKPIPSITDNKITKTYNTQSVFELVPNLRTIISNFSDENKGDFSQVIYSDEKVSNDLIVMLEKLLYDGYLDELYRLSSLLEIDKTDFYKRFYPEELRDDSDANVFSYTINKEQFYFLAINNQRHGHDNNVVYVEDGGVLTKQDSWMTENSPRMVIPFQDEYYLIESFNTPHTNNIDRFFVAKLDSSLIKDYSVISFIPKEFGWQQIYDLKENKELTNYVKSIQNELTQGIYIDRETRFYYQQSSTFIGDETNVFDNDILLRLLSTTGYVYQNNEYYNFYEIDYNNDSIPNYLDKYHVGYNLNCDFYDITEKRTVKVDANLIDLQSNAYTAQIWFKEIDDKVYTFKLYLLDEYNFYLTVSLIEEMNESIHQIYAVSPKRSFDSYLFSIDSYFK